MYFSGSIEIDPSQMTMIKRVKPTKLFGKLLDALTFGSTSDKQEHETFTALAILQQINMGLRTLDIKNVIRLAVDDYDFYLDEKGVDDDLSQAMFELKAKIDPIESEVFNTIYLVLEHLDKSLKYLVEISVTRKHQVGEYPIHINVNAVMADLKLKEGETPDDLKTRMGSVFQTQESYEDYVQRHKIKFDYFINELELSIRKVIKVDDIILKTDTKMVRPKRRVENLSQVRNDQHSEPIYYGYYGMGDYFFYSMMWSHMCYNNHIYCNNFTMVDETGHDVMTVGEEGFNAGDVDTLNQDADFEPPNNGDVDYHGGSEYEDQLQESNLLDDADVKSYEGDSTDWLDAGDAGDAGDSGSCSSCSSCSSCGGCGD